MSDKLIRSLSSQITQTLTERKLPACTSKKEAQAMLRRMEFAPRMAGMLPLKERINGLRAFLKPAFVQQAVAVQYALRGHHAVVHGLLVR